MTVTQPEEPRPDSLEEMPEGGALGVPDIYVNAVSASVGAYDVILRFSQQDADPEAKAPHNRLLVKVRMSHAQAWTFAKVLSRLMDKYTSEVGPIHLPEGLVDQLGLHEDYQTMLEEGKQ